MMLKEGCGEIFLTVKSEGKQSEGEYRCIGSVLQTGGVAENER
jgi:hypothetical protein